MPGFGFTEIPAGRNYVYTFDALAKTIEAFTDALDLKKYALYIFDYGAPTGMRLAMAHPERVTAIVSQNGNAYEEGLGDAWAPIRRYWSDPSAENRNAIRGALTAEGMRREYSVGMPNSDVVAPESYTLDAALLARPGNVDIQLDLFLDYANNVKLVSEISGIFPHFEAAIARDLGKERSLLHPAGRRSVSPRHSECHRSIFRYGPLCAGNASGRNHNGNARLSSHANIGRSQGVSA